MTLKNRYFMLIYLSISLMLIIFSSSVEANVINIEKNGSLMIHKVENFTEDQENSHLIDVNEMGLDQNVANTHQSGAHFSIYGRLTHEEVKLLTSNQPFGNDLYQVESSKVAEFIPNKEPIFEGVTSEEGILTWENIPVNTTDVADNLYLIVETSSDGKEQTHQSIPLIVNIPATNPVQEEKENKYLYDVHIYMALCQLLLVRVKTVRNKDLENFCFLGLFWCLENRFF